MEPTKLSDTDTEKVSHIDIDDNSDTGHDLGHELLDALALEDHSDMVTALESLHPADFSDQLEELTAEEREELVRRVPELISGEILAELEDEVVETILPLIPAEQLATALKTIDNDDATQIVEEMEDAQREDVLDALEPFDRAALEASLAFDDETIGRLMQREFVAAPTFWTVGDTIDHMRTTGEELPELFFNIYIVDTAFKPIGYIPVSKLMRFERPVTLESVMDEIIVTIPQDMDQEEAAYLFEKYNLISAPVVDPDGRLVGMMTVDDIIEIIQDENKEDILALAGVSDAGLTDTALTTVKSRAPWLFVNLITAVLASLVIAQFDYAISEIVALAVLMPIVASMGGNAGTQALAVAVRALTERDLTSRTAWRAIRREALAALFIGIIFAVVLAIIAFLWFGDTQLAMVAFVAMIINHVFAGIAGVSVPLILKHYGADPAVASSVFVTTVTDVVGFFAFLGFAAAMLL
ncbi:magnesium transporter [Litorimonas taeanensis]|uniref:Magnesium transporter MgtE n=1 Tax=Litorimonas taeanensis TaxID=568099 RepID=A0A420WMK1_9PROT|nr:magnesium transporter [Litorimonas taeanensis]RKQ72126.1 magnesium transporter [Litorimonas taeanensis]